MYIFEIIIYSGENAGDFLKHETKIKQVVIPTVPGLKGKFIKECKERYDGLIDQVLNGKLMYVDFWGTEFDGFAVCEGIEEH